MKDEATINWYDLKDSQVLYLEYCTMKDLIDKGIKKAGSLSKLGLELNSMQFYNILRNNEGLSVKNLKKLLEFLKIEYDFINGEITEIRKGKKCSIRNPKYPIGLHNPKMGSLLGHLMSDGCLYYDKSRENLIRTKYCGDEQELIDKFMNDLKDVFGEVHFNREFERNCIQIRIGNGIVGEVFRRAGATIGKKYKLNNGLPWIVKKGGKELKRSYLSAIFDDEGSVGNNPFPYVILSRNIHWTFSDTEKRILSRHIAPLMKTNFFPTGHFTKRISIGMLKNVLVETNAKELLTRILEAKPKLLVEESQLLEKTFNITNYTYVISFQLTSGNSYSLQSSLVIRNKKDVIKFYNEIGFSLTKKQKKLKEALTSKRWLDYGA
ncbi:hypothetical protein HYX10_00360 [Candidatus Woesearchaeota archaeon]|nr:hypothetical protein [Candidatus Woesearchaeota archaeon]